MWLATPVGSDNLVPLLEAKGITYQGIKADESHVALILGILTGLAVIVIDRYVVQADESGEIDVEPDARQAARARPKKIHDRRPASTRWPASTKRRKSSRRS